MEPGVFHVRSATDLQPADGYACSVEAVCRARTRAEATVLLRACDVGGFSARTVAPVRSAADTTELELPALAPDEVWVRTTAVPGSWRRRRPRPR